MDREAYREEIKLRLTGGILDLELTDTVLDSIINAALREVQRYIDLEKMITVPFSRCINVGKITEKDAEGNDVPIKVSSITHVFRSQGILDTDGAQRTSMMDPMEACSWQLIGGLGTLQNYQSYMMNLDSWLSMLQIRNTLSTDMSFTYNKLSNLLYINTSTGTPAYITFAYIPKFTDPEEIVSDFWSDVLMRMCIALSKCVVGRIRSKYTQSNALWTLDTNILQEGQQELSELREYMQANTQLCYGID